MKFKTYYFLYNLRSKAVIAIGFLLLIGGMGWAFYHPISGLFNFFTQHPVGDAGESLVATVALPLIGLIPAFIGLFLMIAGIRGVGSLPISFHVAFHEWCEENEIHDTEEGVSDYIEYLLENDLPMPGKDKMRGKV